ncbi:MAG: hypothetical protein JKY50_10810 [Oleispira sp.]|nr:hypothetical protein [Oleispira sp.]MBL4880875.1 hypothetical protein [Oleispira sp.]
MKELLKGKESLVTAFWFLGFAYLLLAAGLFALVMLSQSMIMLGVLIISMIAFFIFYEISIWKCANNCSWVGWSNLARFLVISRAIIVPIIFIINTFVSIEIGNTINWYSTMFEVGLGVITLSIFTYVKISGGELSVPAISDSQTEISNANYLKDAKIKFLAGDYEGALALFNTADSIENLDELSSSFKNMCLRRLNKHNNQRQGDEEIARLL